MVIDDMYETSTPRVVLPGTTLFYPQNTSVSFFVNRFRPEAEVRRKMRPWDLQEEWPILAKKEPAAWCGGRLHFGEYFQVARLYSDGGMTGAWPPRNRK